MRAPRPDVNPTKCVDRACLPMCPTRSVFVLIREDRG
jgi:NAD-dependent dihydropyrimidine dehydrogenase PreA subunit